MSLKFQNILGWFHKKTNIINVLFNEFKEPAQLENMSWFFSFLDISFIILNINGCCGYVRVVELDKWEKNKYNYPRYKETKNIFSLICI